MNLDGLHDAARAVEVVVYLVGPESVALVTEDACVRIPLDRMEEIADQWRGELGLAPQRVCYFRLIMCPSYIQAGMMSAWSRVVELLKELVDDEGRGIVQVIGLARGSVERLSPKDLFIYAMRPMYGGAVSMRSGMVYDSAGQVDAGDRPTRLTSEPIKVLERMFSGDQRSTCLAMLSRSIMEPVLHCARVRQFTPQASGVALASRARDVDFSTLLPDILSGEFSHGVDYQAANGVDITAAAIGVILPADDTEGSLLVRWSSPIACYRDRASALAYRLGTLLASEWMAWHFSADVRDFSVFRGHPALVSEEARLKQLLKGMARHGTQDDQSR